MSNWYVIHCICSLVMVSFSLNQCKMMIERISHHYCVDFYSSDLGIIDVYNYYNTNQTTSYGSHRTMRSGMHNNTVFFCTCLKIELYAFMKGIWNWSIQPGCLIIHSLVKGSRHLEWAQRNSLQWKTP